MFIPFFRAGLLSLKPCIERNSGTQLVTVLGIEEASCEILVMDISRVMESNSGSYLAQHVTLGKLFYLSMVCWVSREEVYYLNKYWFLFYSE